MRFLMRCDKCGYSWKTHNRNEPPTRCVKHDCGSTYIKVLEEYVTLDVIKSTKKTI